MPATRCIHVPSPSRKSQFLGQAKRHRGLGWGFRILVPRRVLPRLGSVGPASLVSKSCSLDYNLIFETSRKKRESSRCCQPIYNPPTTAYSFPVPYQLSSVHTSVTLSLFSQLPSPKLSGHKLPSKNRGRWQQTYHINHPNTISALPNPGNIIGQDKEEGWGGCIIPQKII